MTNNDHYIYQHIRLDTNEVFYIGMGKGKNYQRSRDKNKRSLFWNNVVNKCGYSIEIFLDKLSFNEACKKEIELIAFYGRIDLKTGTLVNMCSGGIGGSFGRVVSDQTKAAISRSNKGKNRNAGRVWSKESREKLSASLKGRIVTKETRIKISQKNKGQIIPDWQRKIIGALAKHRKPNLGKKFSAETKAKIGVVHKGKIETEETKRKKSISHLGKKHSEETIAKMRQSRINYYKNKKAA